MGSIKFALRTLFKTPFVTIVAILSLALGIGANTAIFSLYNQMLIRPLPVERPGELVNLGAPGPKPGSTSCNQAGDCDVVFSYAMFRDLEKAQTVFTGLAAHVIFGANLAARGQTLNSEGVLVSGSYFPTLELRPAIGRLFTTDDDKTIGEPHAVVLSYAYWETHFGSDPSVIGQPLTVNGQSMTIVGVTPRTFLSTTLGVRPRVYVPMTMREQMQPNASKLDNRRAYWAYVFARLKPGVTVEQARTAINVSYHAIINDVEAPLQKGMSDQTMARFRARQATVERNPRGQSVVETEAKTPLALLLGVTAFVLLIACANIANLLLARSAARTSEMAVRLSLGATRRQLIGQLLTESCLLAAFGAVAGLVVASWTLHLLLSLLPPEAVEIVDTSLNPTVMLFTAVLAFGTGLLFGLFPALHSTRPDLIASLKNQAGQPSGSRSAARFRTTLATAQIALSMALLVAAGLFTRSLTNVMRVDLGLNAENVIIFGLSPGLSGYTPERTLPLFERIESDLAALPGARGVTAGRVPLLGGSNWGNRVKVEGFEAGPDTDTGSRFNEVGPGYVQTLGMTLLAGREFTAADGLKAPKVAIVNEEFAKKFNLGQNAVGKHMGANDTPDLDIEIVGLVKNAKYSDVKTEIPPLFFRPYKQNDKMADMHFYVRTATDPDQFLANIPKLIAAIDPNLPVEDLRTLPQQVRQNVFLDRFVSVLSTAFALLATILAAVGLYGVLAYTVTQRTREIGLRMALGAAPERVRGMVLRQVGIMTLIGGAIGLAAAVGIGRLAASLLYKLQGYDPGVLAVSAVALGIVALAAGFVPALRASQIDPMRALRYE
jgi:putative ABC transport system permease protein